MWSIPRASTDDMQFGANDLKVLGMLQGAGWPGEVFTGIAKEMNSGTELRVCFSIFLFSENEIQFA